MTPILVFVAVITALIRGHHYSKSYRTPIRLRSLRFQKDTSNG